MLNQELWQAALGEIELNISKANFVTWFRNTQIVKKENGLVTITVPSNFSKEWLENKYYKFILKALRNISPEIKELNFVITSPASFTETLPTGKTKKEGLSLDSQPGFKELEIDKETNLNPKYTFSSFVVGSFNELAQAAAHAVVQNLGQLYNPLFVYGGVGLGKTHLLQAIGNEVMNSHKNKTATKKKIKYISSERFASEFVDALQNGQAENFKNHYRQIDVLIIDDVQFLTGKERTQEEFFHTFNALYQKNKQIIMSSDRPPKAIATLEERLKSRFEGGMIVDIGYPDLETRLAILKTKLEEKKFNLPNEILEYIASHIQKNIRELEGALNGIIASVKLKNNIPTLTQLAKDLSRFISVPKKLTNYKNIIKAVAEFYDINIDNLINKCRRKEVVWPRQIAMFLMREELKSSYPFIGEKLGGRDHTTIMYACKKLTHEIENNESLQQEINLIKERIYT